MSELIVLAQTLGILFLFVVIFKIVDWIAGGFNE